MSLREWMEPIAVNGIYMCGINIFVNILKLTIPQWKLFEDTCIPKYIVFMNISIEYTSLIVQVSLYTSCMYMYIKQFIVSSYIVV